MHGNRLLMSVSVAVLAAAAVAINIHAPTVFFDSQIMLGGSLGVFALLQFGWPGLVVGMAALVVTCVRWGHPFEFLVGTGFLVWLRIYLDRVVGGRADRGHVRVLLAATAYWFLVGFWLEVAFFRLAFGLGGVAAASLGLKESVSGLCNATLGFLLFAAVRAVQSRGDWGDLRTRDLASGLALAATTIPSIALVIILSGQVKQAALQAQVAEMRAFGMEAARAVSVGTGTTPSAPAGSGGGMYFAVRETDRILASSDPPLFARIARDYEVEAPSRTGIEELAIYRPRRDAAVITKDGESYLLATFPLSDAATDADHTRVTVAQPLGVLVNALDYRLILPAFLVILGFLVAGTIVSNVMDTVSGRREQAERLLSERSVELDATQRRLERAARELTETDRRFRYFFELPMIGTAISSRTKGWLAANDETCRILGYPHEELFRKTWADITHPDDLPADEAQFERMLRREIDGYQLEKRFIRKDGTVVHTLIAAACGPIGDATPDAFYVSITDITERKRLEEELRHSEERHRLLADNAADVINVIDLGGRLLYVSPSVEKLIGYTQEEALRLSIEEILVPQAAAGARAGLAATAAAIESGAPLPEFHGEFEHRRKDGSTVWAEATSSCMVDKDGKYVATLVVTRDISARKRLEAELAAAREREKLAERKQREVIEQKLKTSLNAAAVAHEINQPLSRVLLRARMGLETATGGDRDTLAALVADAERVVSIIQKMKVLLRNVETVQGEVDLADITASAMHQVKRPLREAGVAVICGGVERGCLVLGDEVQLQMVVTNLVTNAIEAITQGGSDRREIVVEHHVHVDSVELVVGDSGPGWPGGTIDEVLLQTTKPGGAGIGLYVVKTAVENHRGQVTVGRSPLGGAEFRVTFPRVAAAAT